MKHGYLLADGETAMRAIDVSAYDAYNAP